ncbi:unnamed protein product [Phytophthora fragariaefolia]|uniref:Unnamed protein product n=1 Tax=Phytophthora fragariaefolia TaxID=1490495 RepID=A0A9W7D8Z9_9STRA|nr:unnamed protein product [Phytophthora fragariaefolia]
MVVHSGFLLPYRSPPGQPETVADRILRDLGDDEEGDVESEQVATGRPSRDEGSATPTDGEGGDAVGQNENKRSVPSGVVTERKNEQAAQESREATSVATNLAQPELPEEEAIEERGAIQEHGRGPPSDKQPARTPDTIREGGEKASHKRRVTARETNEPDNDDYGQQQKNRRVEAEAQEARAKHSKVLLLLKFVKHFFSPFHSCLRAHAGK